MIPQPKAIADYNRFMNGVDLHDQMRKKYSCGRASKKYWKYLMWFIIDCARTNAYIIFREDSPKEAVHSVTSLRNLVNLSLETSVDERDCVSEKFYLP